MLCVQNEMGAEASIVFWASSYDFESYEASTLLAGCDAQLHGPPKRYDPIDIEKVDSSAGNRLREIGFRDIDIAYLDRLFRENDLIYLLDHGASIEEKPVIVKSTSSQYVVFSDPVWVGVIASISLRNLWQLILVAILIVAIVCICVLYSRFVLELALTTPGARDNV